MAQPLTSAPATDPPPGDPDELGDAGSLVVEDHGFAIVGDWVINAEISDAAFRVYSLLLRFGGSSGCRMPSRGLLARRLHRSVDSIDRALRELVDHGIVRVEHRHAGRRTLSNRYHVRTSSPTAPAPAPENRPAVHGAAGHSSGRGRKSAAPRTPAAPGSSAAHRESAAPPAANLRPYRDVLTETPPPPAPSPASRAPGWRTPEETLGPELLAACGIDSLEELSRRCVASRQALGQPMVRWSPQCLVMAIRLAVDHRGWPAASVVQALLAVATDPATRSPGRLAEAGPWWDQATGVEVTVEDVSDLEQRLDDVAGRRPALQAQARAELTGEGLPLTKATGVRRACDILDRQER